MVFLFQETWRSKPVQAAAPFKPAEPYPLNLGKAIEGTDGATAVQQKTAKYLEYALKEKGYPLSKALTAKVPGSILNDISSQSTINALVNKYNAPQKGDSVPEFEKLQYLNAGEVIKAIKTSLQTMKLP